MQLILEKLEANGTFNDREAEWKRQARTGRNQSIDVCKTTLHVQRWALQQRCWFFQNRAVVIRVKILTKSVAVARLNIEHDTKAGQCTRKCSLPAACGDAKQMSVEELKAMKQITQTTIDGHHHKRY